MSFSSLLTVDVDHSGQVGGVAVSSALFQSRLDTALRRSITGPGAEEVRWS